MVAWLMRKISITIHINDKEKDLKHDIIGYNFSNRKSNNLGLLATAKYNSIHISEITIYIKMIYEKYKNYNEAEKEDKIINKIIETIVHEDIHLTLSKLDERNNDLTEIMLRILSILNEPEGDFEDYLSSMYSLNINEIECYRYIERDLYPVLLLPFHYESELIMLGYRKIGKLVGISL